MRILKSLALLLLLYSNSCSREKVPDGRIMIKNDTEDRTYNEIEVTGSGIGVTLKPGQKTILPRTTLRFTVKREYEKYTRSYTVECPRIEGAGIKIRLIDIHVNRIAGGCNTIDASKY